MLIRLLENNELISVYQPIVDTYRASIIGYESLVRGPEGCALHTPSALFHEAAMHGLVDSLEMYCTQNAVAQFKPEQFHGQLFINTNPNLLCTHDFVEQLLSLQRSTTAQIVIELSEQHAVTQLNELKRVVHRLRIAGLQFAIDDLGAGHSSLKLWAEIRPEYVKIDRYFVQDIHLNPYKREFVQHIVTLAKNMHATVIAEGIEKIEELRQVQKIGIFAAQGFFIGRPSTEVLVDDRLQSLLHHDHQVERYDSLHSLIEETTTVHPHRRVADVFDYFQQNKRLVAIPVVANEKIKGIIRRGQFMELMSSNFGHALYANKPAELVMQTNILVIDANAPIEQASALLTDHEDTLEQQVLLIHKNGIYAGIIAVPSLLRRITELRIQNARYANPLTLLPGNVPLSKEIDRRLADNSVFQVLYFDLNHFKPYNDVYGYHQGDLIIKWFARLLQNTFCKPSHYVGHIGGDDFIVIATEEDVASLPLDNLKHFFMNEINDFYRSEHLESGGIIARARDGRFQRFPILDYSVGVVIVTPGSIHSHQEVATLAADLKGQAKRSKNGIAVRQSHSIQVTQHRAHQIS